MIYLNFVSSDNVPIISCFKNIRFISYLLFLISKYNEIQLDKESLDLNLFKKINSELTNPNPVRVIDNVHLGLHFNKRPSKVNSIRSGNTSILSDDTNSGKSAFRPFIQMNGKNSSSEKTNSGTVS